MPATGTLSAPGRWPSANAADGAHVQHLRRVGRHGELLGLGLRADEGAAVQLDDPLHVRRSRRRGACRLGDEERDVVVRKSRIEAALEAHGRRRLRTHRLAAERARDVPRVDLHAVSQLDDPPQGVEQALGALAGVYGEIGAGRVADEQRVAGEHDPRLVAAAAVAHREAAVLRPVPGRVDAAEDDVAEHDLRAVLERVVRILGLGGGMDAHGDPVLEREPPVAGEVIGVRVGLDRADDAHVALRGLVEVLLDREGRVDDDRVARSRVADEIRSASERVVDELREDHGRARRYQRLPLFLLKCRRGQAFPPGQGRPWTRAEIRRLARSPAHPADRPSSGTSDSSAGGVDALDLGYY